MLNKDDKEYLKNNVEKKIDDIDRKIEIGDRNVSAEVKKAVTDPNSHFGKKLKAIYDKQNEKDDRDKYIDELLTKKDKGEATLAEKVELIKASLDKKLPDDFKDGMKAMTDTMKKGGSQAMQGISHLTGRIMMSNPLTAMLWENRDVLKAVGDIGLGGLKMGAGLLGAVGKGTAGILKASVNLFKKKKKQKIEDSVPEQDEVVEKTGSAETAEEITDEKSSAQKITEIHDLFFKGDFFKALEKQDEPKEREARNRQSVLSKGLAGIGKTMQVISGVIETIMAKQKLILGGLMIGAMGILALIGWLKNKFGSIENMINGFKDKVGFKESTPETTPQDTYEVVKKESERKSIERHDTISDAINSEKSAGDIEEVKKAVNINTRFGKGGIDTPLLSGYKMKANAGQPYRAPFDLKVINWQKNSKNKNSIDMEVERTETLTKKNAVIMNLEDPQVAPGQTAKKGQIIGRVPQLGEIFIKDITKEEFEEYKNMIDTFAKRSDKEKAKELSEVKEFMNAKQSNLINDAWSALGMDTFHKNNKSNDTIFEDGKLTKGDIQRNRKNNEKGSIANSHELDSKQWEGASISTSKSNPFTRTYAAVKEAFIQPEWDRNKELSKQNNTDEKVKKQQETLKGLEEKRKEQEAKDANGEKLSQNNVPQPIVIPSGNRDNSILPAEHVNDLSAALMLQA